MESLNCSFIQLDFTKEVFAIKDNIETKSKVANFNYLTLKRNVALYSLSSTPKITAAGRINLTLLGYKLVSV